jgi:hypothetical protein
MKTGARGAVVAAAVAMLVATYGSPGTAGAAEPQPCSAGPYSGDRIALVVGTDDYSVYNQPAAIKNLDNAVHDARTVAALLYGQGFMVRCLTNPTKLAFDAEQLSLADYLNLRSNGDPDAADAGRAVIYVAGHGYRDPIPDGDDYLLFPYDPDDKKYSKPVDLNSHAGRVKQGRFSMQSLVDGFSTIRHALVFIFDACRSNLNVGPDAPAEPAGSVLKNRLNGRQVVLYSTQPGGVAIDGIPGSNDPNGLYAWMLSRFMDLPLNNFGHAIGLTQRLVQLKNKSQAPIHAAATDTLFLGHPWADEETSDACDLMDTDIWNAAGLLCSDFDDPKCLRKDICKVVNPLLKGASKDQAKICLARHKSKWLRARDLADVCGTQPLLTSTLPGVISNVIVPTSQPIRMNLPAVRLRIPGLPAGAGFAGGGERIAAGSRAPASISGPAPPATPAPSAIPVPTTVATTATPGAVQSTGRNNAADVDAYNVITVTEPNLSTADLARITLIGWANKTPSLFAGINQMSPEGVAAIQRSLDRRLLQMTDVAARRAFTVKQRDYLIVQSSERTVPQQTALPPFEVSLKNGSFTLRSLPSANADRIGIYGGTEIAAGLDCYTIPCTNGWIGVRLVRDGSILRGWVSAEDLKTAVVPGISIEVGYDGKRVAPRRDSIAAIQRAVRPDPSTSSPRGRIQVIATRSTTEESKSSFLAGARLSYLDRVLIDLGVHPNDVVKTVVDVPSLSQLPPVIMNLSKR